MGPALGGGYGRYMGYWGLAADNVISFDVVLADGSTTEVSSTSKPDLFWAMRGAGHNFGIVTQFKYNVYDRPSADWYYSLMTFTSDKLEAFFALYNAQNADGRQPKELITTSEFRLNPNVSKTEVRTFRLNGVAYLLTKSTIACRNLLRLLRRHSRSGPTLPCSLPQPRTRRSYQRHSPLSRPRQRSRNRHRQPSLPKRQQRSFIPCRTEDLQRHREQSRAQPHEADDRRSTRLQQVNGAI